MTSPRPPARTWIVLSVCAAALIAFGFVGTGRAADMVEVIVHNFPETQEVKGVVDVGNLTPPTLETKLDDRVISPVDVNRPTDYQDLGVLRFGGYSRVALGIAGEIKGFADKGEVGILLIPEIDIAIEAWRQKGRAIFPISFVAKHEASRAPYLYSSIEMRDVAFGTYRAFAYNTTGRTVEIDVTAYLSR